MRLEPPTRLPTRIAAVAIFLGGLLALGAATVPEDPSWRVAADLARTGETLRARLNAARSELQQLGVSSASPGRGEISHPDGQARGLEAFLGLHRWSRSVLLVPAEGRAILVQRQTGPVACGLDHARETARLPRRTAFLAPVEGARPPRLCMGVPFVAEDGRRAAIVAEVDPAALFADLAGRNSRQAPPRVTDGSGRTILGPRTQGAARAPVDLALGLPGWHGPSAGTWRVASSGRAGTPPRGRPLPLSGLLGVVSCAGVLAIGGRVVVRRQSSVRGKDRPAAVLPQTGPWPAAVFGGVAELVPGAPVVRPEQNGLGTQAVAPLLAANNETIPDDAHHTSSAVARVAPRGSETVRRPPTPVGPAAAQGVARAKRAWRALVAEDDAVSQRVIAGLLDRLGGEVDVVGNGREAIEAIAAHHYDIVFMDYRMPGVDGVAATREIRRGEPAGQRTPIVAVTANTSPTDRERCMAAGMDDFLAKPVHSVDLHGAIDRHVDGKRLEVLAPSLAPATGDCPGPVDPGVIERLIAIEAAGVPGFFAELTRDFEQGSHERLQELRRAVQTCDASLMESAAHSLKGTAALLGASTLSEQCRRLEDLARRGAAGGCGGLVASLADEHASVRAVLEVVAASPRGVTPVLAAAGGAPHSPTLGA